MGLNGTSDMSERVLASRRGNTGRGTRLGFRAAYDDEASAAAYAQHFDPAFGRRFAERALDALVVVRGAQVLDVACGTGVFARLSAHVVGPSGQVVGIDPSAIAVATARRIDPTSIVDWQEWDDGRLPFGDGAFDVVACQHALHRFPDPDLVLAEMRRVLAPGGRLGITTWGPIEENPAFAAQLDAVVKAGLDESGVVDTLLDAFAWHRTEDLRTAGPSGAGLGVAGHLVPLELIRMLAALRPRAAEWVRVYPLALHRSRRSGPTGWMTTERPRPVPLPGPPSSCEPFEHDSDHLRVYRRRPDSSWPAGPTADRGQRGPVTTGPDCS